MTENDVTTAVALKKQIDAITDAQAAIAATGSAGSLAILDTAGNSVVNADKLKLALGATAYNTQCSNAKTALSTALATALTTADDALTAL